MLLTRLVSLVSGSARGRRLLWRGWYQFLAARYRDPRWTFMNYGYRSPDVPAPALDPADEPDRSFIQLYDVVARGAPLAGRELLEVGCGRGGGRPTSPARSARAGSSPSICRPGRSRSAGVVFTSRTCRSTWVTPRRSRFRTAPSTRS